MSRFYAICFDVRDSRRGQKIANELLNFGHRVQYSLFECYLSDKELRELQQRINSLANMEEDHFRYYPLCGKDEEKVVALGGSKVENPDYILN
ncbi:MAG: CRISPR-associated endonuclease Cas2 [Desulfobulbus propionicus]|nr:MAG: CRISPR-associated endonuclease Cas2 [Desulfobulbus propionicus]